ncbi:molybdopterin-dependent oxidoreductase [Pseudokineococcus basanitobsidens]|uniref:Molybdopterin-dependent oxidoreductase n=1 Tax=Pseudokineococcus basanitobsidens TaxID=1926649 RepID=A0ABU8RLD9_9ACTN
MRHGGGGSSHEDHRGPDHDADPPGAGRGVDAGAAAPLGAFTPPRTLPPGQRQLPDLPVMHYGRVPRFRPERWTLVVEGATRDGGRHVLDHEAFSALPRRRVRADLHCAARWSVLDNEWEGVPTRDLVDRHPPADDVTAVLVYAEYGYSATVRLEDLTSPRTLLATHRGGEPLTPEHGYPVRLVLPHLYSWKGPKWFRGWEYLTEVKRGFWEDRGYHAVGDCWRQERYAYQEDEEPGLG